MKSVIVILTWILCAFSVYAEEAAPTSGVYHYDYWYPIYADQYLQQVEQSAPHQSALESGNPQCTSVYQNVLNKGTMDIRYALGYFDDSRGTEIVFDGRNYGLSPSLDIEIFYVMKTVLTKKCEGSRALCGFTESGDPKTGRLVFEKKIQMHGREVAVKLALTHASASESFERNLGELKERQAFLTQQSEENYFGGLGVADVVFYNGHSRNGGGPDFNPPILDKTLHVNYSGYYKVQRPGIKRALSLIKKNPNKDSIVGFFSCYSQSHFHSSLLRANPKQKMILASDTIDYLDSLKGSIGYLEGILKGECSDNLAKMAKHSDSVVKGFKGFQIK